MDVLMVGAGAMGRWLGRVLLEVDDSPPDEESLEVSFYDTDPDVAEATASETGGRALHSLDDDEFDLVCIAVPIPVASAAMEEHAPRARTAVIDVTGTMTEPVELMARYAPECERCSLHPLFAPANEPGNIPVVVDENGPVTSYLRNALVARGNHVFETTPDEHDAAMETVQAKAHAAVLSFALAADEVPDAFHTPISAELCALADAVLDGNPSVYAEIQGAFAGATDVVAAAERIAAADTDGFEDLYRIARSRRRS